MIQVAPVLRDGRGFQLGIGFGDAACCWCAGSDDLRDNVEGFPTEAKPDSDVDLLVVESEPFSAERSRRKEAARLYMALRKLTVSKDILLYSRDKYEHWKNSQNHVVGLANREGRLLYGRP